MRSLRCMVGSTEPYRRCMMDHDMVIRFPTHSIRTQELAAFAEHVQQRALIENTMVQHLVRVYVLPQKML
jgi:hypothetical protein